MMADMASSFRYLVRRILRKVPGPIRHRKLYLPFVSGKFGLEIGGPSDVFRRRNPVDIYRRIGGLDNCNFSSSTIWADQDDKFYFTPEKSPGKSMFREGSDLANIPDNSYDFVLSSHNLEHMANPVKALREWKRVLRPEGALIVVLPYYKKTFDHRREPTRVDHILEDFERNIGEDDLTHLPEILEKHDLSMDLAAGTLDEFHKRSLDNISNRCLHHHVFDEKNSSELLRRSGYEVRAVELAEPNHICLLAVPSA
ncbi:hypothetical protein BH10ACI4_BH10ACI4_01070 [soil metagenome]